MLIFLDILFALATAFWIGAMFGFGALTAPTLFRRLPSRDLAGSIAGEIIAKIESVGLVASGTLLVVTVLQAMQLGWSALNLGRVLLVAVMLGLTSWNATSVRSRLENLREQMGPVDQVPETDPRRKEYNRYHRLSRNTFMLVLVLGLVLIGLSAVHA